MGFASSSKISLLPLFAVIPRTFPFLVEIALNYPPVPARPWRHRATRPVATITMSLAQNRKTIPWRVAQDLRAPVADSDLVARSGVDNIRADETQDYQNRQYSEEQKRDHESLPSPSC
jgi:hypothetical protein